MPVADPSGSAVGPDHRTHEVDGLYVADASLFPTASGVNPMLSVMALAHRAAGKVTARLAWRPARPSAGANQPGPAESSRPT